jgi:TonB family protein
MKKLIKTAGVGILGCIFMIIASGQDGGRKQEEETCSGPVYRVKEVTRRAKIIYIREPGFTEEARAHGVEGTVVLTAVLCRTGKVTDIKVVEGLPDGLTEKAIESTRGIKFEPAEKDGEVVSQFLKRELHFSIYRGR